ncbi:MAG: Crp/Fnr family transcriptional regulator [Bacillota bacterium]
MAGEVDYLKRITIFNELADEEMEKVASIVLTRRYKKGMIIFMEGEPGDGLYFVKAGRVKVAKILEDGREKTLHYLQEGDIFAEVLLFDPEGEFPATAEAVEDSVIGIVRNQEIENLLQSNPQITLKILHYMSRRLRQAQQHVRDLAFKDTYGRLAVTLLRLAQEYGQPGAEGTVINISLSQQELANLIGSSRETVARILGDFRKEGSLKMEKQIITILNEKKLTRWT